MERDDDLFGLNIWWDLNLLRDTLRGQLRIIRRSLV